VPYRGSNSELAIEQRLAHLYVVCIHTFQREEQWRLSRLVKEPLLSNQSKQNAMESLYGIERKQEF